MPSPAHDARKFSGSVRLQLDAVLPFMTALGENINCSRASPKKWFYRSRKTRL
jgi:hypothetical protein